MQILTAPTGKLISGDVLDVNRKNFDRALRAYDPLLYTKWNPKKVGGWGCWEIRRRPEYKVIVDYAEYKNDLYLRLEYKELNHINHVLDIAFLNYNALEKVKSMDSWKHLGSGGKVNETNVHNWIEQLDNKAAELLAMKEAKVREERNYQLRSMSKQMSVLREAVLSGTNPHEIALLMQQSSKKR